MGKKYIILSVEDNEADFLLLEKALKKIKDLDLNIVNVKDGKNALDFVEKTGQFSGASTPDLIILDLNLPGMTGLEVLEKIKTDENHKIIPVVVYTSSINDKDIQKSYKKHANSYVNKSFNIDELFCKIDRMGKYWLKTVTMPRKE